LHFTGENYSRGFRKGFGEATLDEKMVEPLAAWLWFHERTSDLRPAQDEEFCDFTEARSTICEGRDFGNGFRDKLVSNLV
jgi:hypothetical protein